MFILSAEAGIFVSKFLKFNLIMPLSRQKKQEIINDLKEKISRQKAMVFVDFSGLKIKEVSVLKKKLNQSDSLFKVSKKTLLKIALKNLDSSLSQKVSELKGELGVVFGFKDEMSPAKTVYSFSLGNEKLKILGGFFEGKFIGKETVNELAQIPTREELLARVVGSISAPVSNLVNVLQGNIKGLVRVLSLIKQ